jgi:hypothetical protein
MTEGHRWIDARGQFDRSSGIDAAGALSEIVVLDPLFIATGSECTEGWPSLH